MDRARDHALAGAGLTLEADRRAHRGGAPHRLAHALDGARRTDQRFESRAPIELVLHLGDAARHALSIEALTQRRQHRCAVLGRVQELVRATSHRLERDRVAPRGSCG
jgi:hypothetical protein